MLANIILDEDLDGAMKQQEWLFRSYIGSDDNHRRIDALKENSRKNKGNLWNWTYPFSISTMRIFCGHQPSRRGYPMEKVSFNGF
jgi:hypothetical protein